MENNLTLNSKCEISKFYQGDNTNWWQPYEPIVREWYPTHYPIWINRDNKIETAFKIVQKLTEKKLIKVETVKDFIEIVNEISTIC